jgi:hypothetical protein
MDIHHADEPGGPGPQAGRYPLTDHEPRYLPGGHAGLIEPGLSTAAPGVATARRRYAVDGSGTSWAAGYGARS